MADLIDRQAAIKAFKNFLTIHDSRGVEYLCSAVTMDGVNKILSDLPSVEAEPVRQTAEWIYGEKDGADGWYCSKCGFHIPWYYDYYGLKNINFIRDFHICPHCDAKMLKYTGMDEVT